MRSNQNEASFSDRIYQRIEQRNKTNNYPAPQQTIIHNYHPSSSSTSSEDAQAPRELRDQMAQLITQQRQDSLQLEQSRQQQEQQRANIEELRLENEQKDQIINRFASQENLLLRELLDKDHIIEKQVISLEQKDEKITELSSEIIDKNATISNQNTTIRELTDTNHDLKNKLVSKDKEMEGLQERLGETKERVEDLRDQVKDLREDKIIFVNDKRILQEEKQLAIVEKTHYYEVTVEQANRIAVLEQVHCNIPDHLLSASGCVSPDFVMIGGDISPEFV